MKKKLYEILDIEEAATAEQIKSAYRKLALKHHPDRNKNNEDAAKEKFQELQKAYEILSDSHKRQQYDRGEIDESGQPILTQPNSKPSYQHSTYQSHKHPRAQSSSTNHANHRQGGSYHNSNEMPRPSSFFFFNDEHKEASDFEEMNQNSRESTFSPFDFFSSFASLFEAKPQVNKHKVEEKEETYQAADNNQASAEINFDQLFLSMIVLTLVLNSYHQVADKLNEQQPYAPFARW